MIVYGVYVGSHDGTVLNTVQKQSPDGKRQIYIMNNICWIRDLPPPIGDSGWAEIGKDECEKIIAEWEAP